MKHLLSENKVLRGLAFASLLTFSTATASAQNYNPPNPMTFEASLPGPGSPDIGLVEHTSAYTWEMVGTALGAGSLSLAGWDATGGPNAISWTHYPPGMPGVPNSQGVIPYPGNVRDLEVGYLQAGGPKILVAYHVAGVGHMLDVYDFASGIPMLMFTQPLSGMANYTRISIDCHLEYAATVAWEDVNGINIVMINNTFPLTFSGAVLLNGTLGETTVDVAFTHTGPLAVQCVYYNPVTGIITESDVDYWTLLPMPAGSVVAPNVNDRNLVGACRPGGGTGGGGNPDDPHHPGGPGTPGGPPPTINQCVYMNIDARGHDGQPNWAYTYTTDDMNISVRVRDFAFNPLTAYTQIVNNGIDLPGQIANNMFTNKHPFCIYERGCQNLMTGWYTNAPDMNAGWTPAGYIAVETNPSVTALISPNDYLTIANNPTWASPTPILSMSKQDDMSFENHTIFPELDMGGNFQMQYKLPNWCTGSYKQSETPANGHFCNDADKLAAFHKNHKGATGISAYPNPFNSTLSLNIPAVYQQSDATITITNLMGVVAGKYTGQMGKANVYLKGLSKDLPTGTYVINVNIKGQTTTTDNIKVVKVD